MQRDSSLLIEPSYKSSKTLAYLTMVITNKDKKEKSKCVIFVYMIKCIRMPLCVPYNLQQRHTSNLFKTNFLSVYFPYMDFIKMMFFILQRHSTSEQDESTDRLLEVIQSQIILKKFVTVARMMKRAGVKNLYFFTCPPGQVRSNFYLSCCQITCPKYIVRCC